MASPSGRFGQPKDAMHNGLQGRYYAQSVVSLYSIARLHDAPVLIGLRHCKGIDEHSLNENDPATEDIWHANNLFTDYAQRFQRLLPRLFD